jgi:ABC-2 type transport system ATP-binding protein
MTSVAPTVPDLQPPSSAALSAVVPDRLRFEGVTKRWDKREPPLLDGVDLALRPGTLAAVVGRNGAGKTTLLRIAAGLISPNQGRTRLDGLDSVNDRREYQRGVGYVSAAHAGLYARLSVRQHLEFAAKLALMSRADRKIAIEVAINRFELKDLLVAHRVDRLSMGQRQRVRLALGFLHDPKLVLLDEPWNSLDAEGRQMLLGVLTLFATGGGTAVCCSPTGEELGPHADETYVVGEGKVVRK